MTHSPWLADYTWTEVEAAIAAGTENLLLMLGATEQHGPHLPLATDTIIAEALAAALAERVAHTLIAPIIPLGTSDEHMDFTGTLSLSKATLAALIADVGHSAHRHGFRRLLVFSAHGGNYDSIRMGVDHLRDSTPALEVIALLDLRTAMRLSTAVPKIAPFVAGLHAGEHETSQMLFLRLDLVRRERAEAGYTGDMVAVVPRLMEAGLRPVTPNGVLGDPTAASPERGERYIAQQADALAAYVAAALSLEF